MQQGKFTTDSYKLFSFSELAKGWVWELCVHDVVIVQELYLFLNWLRNAGGNISI